MRIRLIVAWLVFSAAAQASSTLRVGSQVLVAGDSAARVTELLGKPSHTSRQRGGSTRRKGHVRAASDATGERWQYRRDGHVTTVTIVDGRVEAIDDRRL